MIQQSFCQGPFLVSGLHGDQILGARDNQQDTFSILVGEDAFLLVLADGMGGYTGGELASRAAVEGFSKAFEREYLSPGERMKAAVAAANEQVLAVRKKGGKDDENGNDAGSGLDREGRGVLGQRGRFPSSTYPE